MWHVENRKKHRQDLLRVLAHRFTASLDWYCCFACLYWGLCACPCPSLCPRMLLLLSAMKLWSFLSLRILIIDGRSSAGDIGGCWGYLSNLVAILSSFLWFCCFVNLAWSCRDCEDHPPHLPRAKPTSVCPRTSSWTHRGETCREAESLRLSETSESCGQLPWS